MKLSDQDRKDINSFVPLINEGLATRTNKQGYAMPGKPVSYTVLVCQYNLDYNTYDTNYT